MGVGSFPLLCERMPVISANNARTCCDGITTTAVMNHASVSLCRVWPWAEAIGGDRHAVKHCRLAATAIATLYVDNAPMLS
jgi:hypothetical protein